MSKNIETVRMQAYAYIWGKNIPSRWDSDFQGPEAGASVAGAYGEQGDREERRDQRGHREPNWIKLKSLQNSDFYSELRQAKSFKLRNKILYNKRITVTAVLRRD